MIKNKQYQDLFLEIRPQRKIRLIYINNNSPKTIFFLHGLGGRAEQFQAQIDYFKNDYNIIAPDLLGQGQSEKPVNNPQHSYSFAELFQDIQALFNNYQTEENFIVGHSYGGTFATYLTLKNPQKIKKLALITPANLQPVLITRFFNIPLFLLEMLRPPFYIKIFAKMIFDSHTDPKLIEREISIAQKNPLYVIKALIQGLHKIPQSDISQIMQPVLVIIGINDKLTYPRQIIKFYKKLPWVKFQEITQASHLVLMEKPDDVNKLLENFF